MVKGKIYVVTHVNEDMRATAAVFTNEEAAELYREYCESENRKSIEVGEVWPADTFTWQTENETRKAGKPEETPGERRMRDEVFEGIKAGKGISKTTPKPGVYPGTTTEG